MVSRAVMIVTSVIFLLLPPETARGLSIFDVAVAAGEAEGHNPFCELSAVRLTPIGANCNVPYLGSVANADASADFNRVAVKTNVVSDGVGFIADGHAAWDGEITIFREGQPVTEGFVKMIAFATGYLVDNDGPEIASQASVSADVGLGFMQDGIFQADYIGPASATFVLVEEIPQSTPLLRFHLEVGAHSGAGGPPGSAQANMEIRGLVFEYIAPDGEPDPTVTISILTPEPASATFAAVGALLLALACFARSQRGGPRPIKDR